MLPRLALHVVCIESLDCELKHVDDAVPGAARGGTSPGPETPAGGQAPWTGFRAAFWFQLVAAPLVGALFITVAGLWLLSMHVRAVPLIRADASNLGEKHVMQFQATVQVKIRFVSRGHKQVTTYIYPNREVHLARRLCVPKTYATRRYS